MDRHDINIKQQMSSGPLRKEGFTQELMHKIEKRIDQQKRQKRTWLFAISGLCFALFAAIFVIQPYLQPQSDSLTTINASGTMNASSGSTQMMGQAEMKTALLLALRSDHPSDENYPQEYSTYRTILIAGKSNKAEQVAGGSGLLVPVGQDFWRIDNAVLEPMKDQQLELLNAYPVKEPSASVSLTSDLTEYSRISEKVLFAGNQYISIAETKVTKDGSKNHKLKVLDINSLERTPYHEKESGLSLQELLYSSDLQRMKNAVRNNREESVALNADSSWGIARQPGKWKALKQMETTSSEDRKIVLEELKVPLPYNLVSYDVLCCSWQEIKQIQPAAVDALSSPDKDVVVILTQTQIIVYPYQNGIVNDPMLNISLQEGEKLVMAHWALPNYVEKWKVEVTEQLK
ncbi:hypothetical protein [Marinicrinis lubricantis]|uniref:Uncharacterized protein n=1 Tax=Marinicrinis lubricantis TaxID=2086470 RepID=A0ABW1IJH9_9BACL